MEARKGRRGRIGKRGKMFNKRAVAVPRGFTKSRYDDDVWIKVERT